METRFLYVNSVKTVHVLLVISMFMIDKKGFSVTSEQWIHRKCARLTRQEYKELETKEDILVL